MQIMQGKIHVNNAMDALDFFAYKVTVAYSGYCNTKASCMPAARPKHPSKGSTQGIQHTEM